MWSEPFFQICFCLYLSVLSFLYRWPQIYFCHFSLDMSSIHTYEWYTSNHIFVKFTKHYKKCKGLVLSSPLPNYITVNIEGFFLSICVHQYLFMGSYTCILGFFSFLKKWYHGIHIFLQFVLFFHFMSWVI